MWAILAFDFSLSLSTNCGKARIPCKSLKWHWNGIVYSARASSSYCCPYHFCLLTILLLRLCCYGRKKNNGRKNGNKQTSLYRELCTLRDLRLSQSILRSLGTGRLVADGITTSCATPPPSANAQFKPRRRQSESGLEGEREWEAEKDCRLCCKNVAGH